MIDFRKIIAPGDVFFVMHHDSGISETIANVMGSRWSHSGSVYDVSGRDVMLTETSDFDVIHSRLQKYVSNPNVSMEIWRPFGIDDNARLAMSAVSAELVGEVYGYLQLISMGIRRLVFRLTGVMIGNFIHQGVICCEVPIAGLRLYVDAFRKYGPKEMDTEELYQITKSCSFLVFSKNKDEKYVVT